MTDRSGAVRGAGVESHPNQRGQAIVVMVGAILLALALVALIVDGGNVLAQQRVAQNGVDATSEAGAVLLAERLAGATAPSGGWDVNIAGRLAQTAAANNVTVEAAYYTDICGIPLRADGTGAIDDDTRVEDLSVALQVGNASHILPGGSATAPDCPNRLVGPVAGVLVIGRKDVAAYVAGAIGFSQFRINTRATAVAGYLQGYCDSSEGHHCAVLPVAIPVNAVTCNGSGDVAGGTEHWAWNQIVTVPLCKSNPGNVGWLDWTPPGGGAGELVCSIVNTNNPSIILPSWMNVPSTGNVNGGGSCADAVTGISYSGVEGALRKYNGQVILVPQFDLTCKAKNNDPDPISSLPAVVTAPNYGCPNAPGGGTGQNIWYRMPSFAFFQMCEPSMAGCAGRQGAYIQGNNAAECDTGNGGTSCLVGKFVDIMSTGTVGAGVGSGTGSKAVGVQLIK
jgi:hypothetical protein